MKDFVIEKYIKEESVSTLLKFLNSLTGNDILFKSKDWEESEKNS